MIQHQTLHDSWTFHEPKTGRWLKAKVPGCIHQDLQHHDLIPDPFFGCNELTLGWISETDWTYRLNFTPDTELLGREVIELVLDGLDTLAQVSLNGAVVLTSDNMYHRHRIPIKDRLIAGGNILEVRFASAVEYVRNNRTDFDSPRYFNDPVGGSVRLRKQPCQFGWDWGPRLITAGFWRGVRLEGWNQNRLESVRVRQTHAKDRVLLELEPELARAGEGILSGQVLFEGQTVAEINEGCAEITNPQLWWPAGQGAPALYQLKVEYHENGVLVDTWSTRIGLRTIELDRDPDGYEIKGNDGQGSNRFGFRVNGRLIFAKGANWIPAHSFVHGLQRGDYEPLLQAAVAANMNTIRLWGGGIYEHDCFYDLCDELGLLLWHDFMFACDLYPSDDAFLASVKREAEENVARVRHHACLALWCGNNELVMCNGGHLKPGGKYLDGYEKLFHQLLPEVVQRVDGKTVYLRSSPDYALPESSEPVAPSRDEHDWNVWHARAPVEHYETTRHRFVSEFGMQSYPSPEIAATFCPPEQLNIFSPVFDNHQKNSGGNQIIFDYVSRLFRFPKDYRAGSYLSQLNQAWCMKTAVEHWRSISPLCLGAIYWQLNDCWPVASWSSLEFGGKWKALHHEARRFFAPELVTVRHLGKEDKITGNYVRNQKGPVEIRAIQDTPGVLKRTVRSRLHRLDGALLDERQATLDLKPQHGLLVDSPDYSKLVQAEGRDRVYLEVCLLDENETIRARNFSFFVAPRFLQFESGPITTQWNKAGPSRYTLELKSSVFHYAVGLELEQCSARWSDNFFHLPAGEKKEVTVEFFGAVDEKDLAALQVYSLVDTFSN